MNEPNAAPRSDFAGNPATSTAANPVGRPPDVRFDAARQREACLLVGAGCSLRLAARHVGVPESTIRTALQRDPDFAEQFRQAALQRDRELLGYVRVAAQRSWRAAVWTLSHLHPDEFAMNPTPVQEPSAAAARFTAREWADMIEMFTAPHGSTMFDHHGDGDDER